MIMTTLKIGTKGEEVKQLQRLLHIAEHVIVKK